MARTSHLMAPILALSGDPRHICARRAAELGRLSPGRRRAGLHTPPRRADELESQNERFSSVPLPNSSGSPARAVVTFLSAVAIAASIMIPLGATAALALPAPISDPAFAVNF